MQLNIFLAKAAIFANYNFPISCKRLRFPLSTYLVSNFIVSAVSAAGLQGNTIKASFVSSAEICVIQSNECKETSIPGVVTVYLGSRGNVYVYQTNPDGGMVVPLGRFVDDKRGHLVKWQTAGNGATWQVKTDQLILSISFSRRGSACSISNSWKSLNSGLRIKNRGIQISYCSVIEGNANG